MNGYRIYFADDSILECWSPNGLTREHFGFGLWVIRNSTPSEIKTMFRKVGVDNEA